MVAARVDEVPTTQTFKRLLKEIGTGNRKPDDEYGTVQKPFPKPDLIGAGQFHGCNNQKNGKDEGRESETAVYPIVGAVGSHGSGIIQESLHCPLFYETLVLRAGKQVGGERQQHEKSQD